jgi:hypothetical protein
MPELVEVTDSGIRVVDLKVSITEVADFFRALHPEERAFMLTKAIEVGVFCLERGRTAQDTDFVKRKMAELLAQVEEAVATIPAKTEELFAQKIGSGEGQVLSPLKKLVDEASSETGKRIVELKTLLADDLDPKNSKSTLGTALQSLRELLNPKNTDSIQSVLAQVVTEATAENGVMAKAVRSQVEETLKPLLMEIDQLSKEVRGHDAATEALKQTTLKGSPYEEEVTSSLQQWARSVGAEVDHVGTDNQPGDIIIRLNGQGIVSEPISIIVEARDRGSRPMGRSAISYDIAKKIAERNGNAGVYLSRSQDGLSLHEIGEWAEGICEHGPWVACTHQHLITAVRFLIVQKRLLALRSAAHELDSASIELQLKAIRTALSRIKTIKTKLKEMNICSDAVGEQVEHLRDEIKEALTSIECSLQPVAKDRSGTYGISCAVTAVGYGDTVPATPPR